MKRPIYRDPGFKFHIFQPEIRETSGRKVGMNEQFRATRFKERLAYILDDFLTPEAGILAAAGEPDVAISLINSIRILK